MNKVMKHNTYFDIGANLTHESFNKDLSDVIRNAKSTGIKKICITSTSIEDTKLSLKIAGSDKDFFITTCGYHYTCFGYFAFTGSTISVFHFSIPLWYM